MNKPIKVWHLVLALALILGTARSKAQTGAIQYFQPASGTTVANCGTPTVGSPPPLCGFSTDWVVWNGTAWISLTKPAPTGVTSLAVCNAAGASCGAAQTGAVTVNIPKTATAPILQ